MRVPRVERWTLVSAAPEGRAWAEALVTRGVDVDLSPTWPATEADVVVVHAADPAKVSPGTIVVEVPDVVARGATPAAVAEYLLARVAGARATREVTAFRRDQEGLVHKVTHDLNNDIAVVRANLNYLQSMMMPSRDVTEAIDEATDSSRLMEQILADLRLMVAIEQGTEGLMRERVPLRPLLETAVGALRRRFEARGVEPEIVVLGEPFAYGQPTMLARMLTALLGMRARAARRTQLEVRAWREGAQVHVTIADGGTGVLVGEGDVVFERSGVNSQRARELGSTGVSPYLSRLIAEVHGGELCLTELPRFSCVFRVSLPAAPGMSDAPGPEVESGATDA